MIQPRQLKKLKSILREIPHRHLAVKCCGESVNVYDIERLWRESSDLPVFKKSVSEFPLDSSFPWFLTSAAPTVSEIISHMRRIAKADLQHPILLDTRGAVLDGTHRLAKCVLEEIDEINCVQFLTEPTPDWTIGLA